MDLRVTFADGSVRIIGVSTDHAVAVETGDGERVDTFSLAGVQSVELDHGFPAEIKAESVTVVA